jgi:hypothetical protein
MKFLDEILMLAVSLVFIFKPSLFLTSKGDVFERKKKNIRLAGFMLLGAAAFLTLSEILK